VTFEEYLKSKKIDSALFKAAESQRWQEWSLEFEQMHPDSFSSQKLYQLNAVRRKYKLIELNSAEGASKPVAPRVVMKPKPKIG
jgi:hypothetical protein